MHAAGQRRLLVLALTAILIAACGGATTSSAPVMPSASAWGMPSQAPTVAPASVPPLSEEPSDAAQAWTRVAIQGSGPPAREDHTLTADPDSGELWLFGGRDGGTVFGDLWQFDPTANAWHEVEPDGRTPDARFGHTATWVPGQGLVVWSGQAGSTFYDDLWAWDPAVGRWSELPAAGEVPPARYGSCAALGLDGRLWVSHGFTADAGRFDDTVAYDFAMRRWSAVTSPGPVIRCLHDCLFTADGRFVIYGGQTTGAPAIGDLWVRSTQSGWTEAAAADPRPAARALYALGRAGDSAWVFGGSASDRSELGDLWRLDLGTLTWEQAHLDGEGPSPRSGAAMELAPGTDRMMLFGGTTGDGALGDLWELPLPG